MIIISNITVCKGFQLSIVNISSRFEGYQYRDNGVTALDLMYLYHKSLSTAFLDLLGREFNPEFSELSSEFWLVVVVLSEVGL